MRARQTRRIGTSKNEPKNYVEFESTLSLGTGDVDLNPAYNIL